MERMLLEYLVNSLWQAPLLALGAWLVLRAGRPGPRMQHGVWVGVLALMVAMPMLSLRAVGWNEAATDRGASAGAPGQATGAGGYVMLGDAQSAEADAMYQANGVASVVSGAPQAELKQTAPVQSTGWLRMREMRLSAVATHRVVELYLVVIALAAVRLLWSWSIARRMVAEAEPAELSEMELSQLAACCERLGVRAPRVLVSMRTASPLVVGVMRPVLLLPARFAGDVALTDATVESTPSKKMTQYSERELEAVWWHELAHVSRKDYLANLLCRIWVLPVAYHPVTYAVERRVRQTREMVCDGMAARQMRSPVSYARCLLGLAQRMQAVQMAKQMSGAGVGVDLLGNGVLEERVMELIETKTPVSLRMRVLRLAGSGAMLLAVIGSAATFRVMPTLAKVALGSDEPVFTAEPVPAVVAPVTMAEALQRPKLLSSRAYAAVERGFVPALRNMARIERAQTASAQVPADAQEVAPETPTVQAEPALPASLFPRHKIPVPQAILVLPVTPKFLLQQKISPDPFQPGAPIAKIWKGGGDALPELTREQRMQLSGVYEELFKATKQMQNAQSSLWITNGQGLGKQFEAIQKQAQEAVENLNSPEFKQRFADAQNAAAKLNDEEHKAQFDQMQKQMQDAMANINSAEFRKKLEESLKQAQDSLKVSKADSPEFQKLAAEMQRLMKETKELGFPPMLKQMPDGKFKGDMSPEAQRQLAESKVARLQQQLDAAQRDLERLKSEGDKKLPQVTQPNSTQSH